MFQMKRKCPFSTHFRNIQQYMYVMTNSLGTAAVYTGCYIPFRVMKLLVDYDIFFHTTHTGRGKIND